MSTNCFAYDPEKGCQILTDSNRCEQDCPFRKSQATADADRLQSGRRLASLSEECQQHIADTYYQGERPWMKTIRKAVRR